MNIAILYILRRLNVLNIFLIFNFNASLLRLSAMDFLIPNLMFLDGIILNISERHVDFRFVELSLSPKHKLLNFLRIAYNILSRSNIDNPSDDDLQPANSSLVQFAEIISNFNDMKSLEVGQSGGIFSLGDTRASNLIISRKGAVDEVDAVRDPDAE